MTLSTQQIDVRSVPPVNRHPLIFSTFAGLADGQALELVNDHDPRPLFQHFHAQFPGGFSWTYLEEGPLTWRVAITRQAAAQPTPKASHGQCCGSCGGA